MKRKTLLILGTVLILGAVITAVAVAQNTDSQRAVTGHECTPEMMESGNCDTAGAAMAGCSSMMADTDNVTGNHMADPNHCSNMNSSMGSMMGTENQKTMA